MKKIICFLCKDIKIQKQSDWESCVLHAKTAHGIDTSGFKTIDFAKDTKGWLVKLPDGNPWIFVSN